MAEGTFQGPSWQLAGQILELAEGEILADNRFLAPSLALLAPAPERLSRPFATDGRRLMIDAGRVIARFRQERVAPTHDLAHLLVHCLLLHPFAGEAMDRDAWSLAADIVAESLAAEISGPRPGERGARQKEAIAQVTKALGGRLTTERLYRALVAAQADDAGEGDGRPADPAAGGPAAGSLGNEPAANAANGEAVAATSAAPRPAAGDPSASSAPAFAGMDRAELAQLFAADDHAPWWRRADAGQGTGRPARQPAASRPAAGQSGSQQHDGASSGQPSSEDGGDGDADAGQDGARPDASPELAPTPAELAEAKELWEKAAKSARVDLQTLSRERGKNLRGLVETLEVSQHERTDFREFLRQFAIESEDVHVSDDEFDYVFYTYGLELYGDMPLIEPLEYQSQRRIRDFAIVLDTSSSVTGKTIQQFVDACFDVLSSEASFFQKVNIHIIQADMMVRSDTVITSLADLARWKRDIRLAGFGGTDFRPAFRYVSELQEDGAFQDLQGLIYFTDGWGIYPRRMPPYKVAFIFYDEDHRPELVPSWALQLTLHPGEFESMSVY